MTSHSFVKKTAIEPVGSGETSFYGALLCHKLDRNRRTSTVWSMEIVHSISDQTIYCHLLIALFYHHFMVMFLQICSKNIYVIWICCLTKVDAMKKFILTLIAASVLLFSVAYLGIANTDAASLQHKSPYKATNVNENGIINPSAITNCGAAVRNKDNFVHRTGAISTQIMVLEPSARVLKLHVGDQITAHARLIRTDTGAGIRGAIIGAQGSLDGKTWMNLPPQYCLTTNGKGEVSYTGTIPDPHAYLPTVQLPMTGYVRAIYAGDRTYVGSESVIYEATLLP